MFMLAQTPLEACMKINIGSRLQFSGKVCLSLQMLTIMMGNVKQVLGYIYYVCMLLVDGSTFISRTPCNRTFM